jgi:hypothetical protein
LALAWTGLTAGEAGAQTYERIFDGVSLKGWHQTGKGNWTVADSVLIGTMAAGGPESYLISDLSAKNFSLRLKFLWGKGNSGVNFRNEQKGDLAMGIQVDLDGANTSGCLYDNVKAAYVAKSDSIGEWYKPNAWNDLVIDAKGTKISVTLNGKRTVEYTDAGGRSEGVFAFQLHVGLAMDVRFKDIEMLDYDKPSAVIAARSGHGRARADRVRHARMVFSGDRGIDGKRIR